MVVEDEALLRIHALDIIRDAGLIAIEAANADEAISILEKRSDVAIIVTDVAMPGSMNGIKLARAVRNRWPPIEIVVVSGHMAVDEKKDLPDGAKFFSKPYETDELIGQLRKMLRG